MTQAPAPPPQLRPLGIGETLDAGIKIYRLKFATMLKAVAVVTVPVQVLAVLVRISLPSSTTTRTTFGTTTTGSINTWAAVAAFLLLFVVGIIASTLAEAACFKAVSDTYVGADTDWRASLRFGYQRLGSLLWLTLLHTLGLALGFVACIVPGIWLYGAWAVAVPALLIERTRGTKALGRSFNLVRGRWWPVAGALLLSNLLASAVAFGFGIMALPFVLAGRGNDFVVGVTTGIFNGAANVLTIPFVSAVVAVIYFDLRVRKEGFDLQLLATRIGAPSPEASATQAPMPWLSPQPGAGGGWVPPPPPGWERTPQGARPIEPPPPSGAPPSSPDDQPPGSPSG